MASQKSRNRLRASAAEPFASALATMAALSAPALVPLSCETASVRLASTTSSTPHVYAPHEPPPCKARLTGFRIFMHIPMLAACAVRLGAAGASAIGFFDERHRRRLSGDSDYNISATITATKDGAMRSYWMQMTDGGTVLELRESVVPAPGPKQLLVRMHAAALNRGEFLLGHGVHGQPGTWKAIGNEGAGEVAAAGAEARNFGIGDRVMGRCAGAFSEYALMEAAEAMAMPPS